MRLPDTIDRVRPSIVQIRRYGPGMLDPVGDTIGTGFLVTDTIIVSAKHVVDSIDLAAGQSLHIAIAGPDVDTPELQMRANFIGMEAELLGFDVSNDLALIRANGIPGAPVIAHVNGTDYSADTEPARLNHDKIREGTEIVVSGYPLSQPSLVTTVGIVASTFAPDGNPGDWQDRYLGDLTANPGNSGGPVYLSHDGSIIGVCVAGRLAPLTGAPGLQSASLTIIVPTAAVLALMTTHGIAEPSLNKTSSTRSKNARKRK